MNRSHSGTLCRLRVLIRAILFIVSAVAVVAAIVNARDVDRTGSVFSERDARQMGRLSTASPTPTPPECPLCWFLHTRSDNFDYVTPPIIATRLAGNKRTRSATALGQF